MKDVEYYRRQIKGLFLIIEEGKDIDKFIARSYVIEKLQMILTDGINFHPKVEEVLDAVEFKDQYGTKKE